MGFYQNKQLLISKGNNRIERTPQNVKNIYNLSDKQLIPRRNKNLHTENRI